MKPRDLAVRLFFCLSIVLFGLSREASAQAEPFYKGKTIRIIIGSTPGGFYDRWARLLARFMVKYIPGQPEIIAQSMPGAGIHDRHQSCVQRDQARRPHHRYAA